MKKLLFVLITLSLTLGLAAKDKPKKVDAPAPVISGQVIDNETGETLAGVTIKVAGEEKPVFTDFDGQFEIKGLAPGEYTLEVSLISYKSNKLKDIKLTVGEQKALKVELKR